MNCLRHKKIRQIFSILACAGLLWAVQSHTAWAASNPLKFTGDILATVGVVFGVLYILQSLLVVALGIVGGFLSFAFALNTAINPGQLIVVQQGWLILRDLANGIFILLLLWIAITIIFNLDQLGGKRFLVKIIMVALLINFSLALVSTVFALGNTLAVPFAKAMGLYPDCTDTTCTPAQTTIADLIIQNSQIHEVTKAVTEQGADTLWKTGLQPYTASQPRDDRETTLQYLGAPQTAHAIAPLVLAGILLKPLAVGAVSWFAGALASGLIAGAIHVSGLDATVLNGIFNMAIASSFLILTSLAMLSAAIILLLRVVAMVFIGVFAPIAFLGIAFPKFGEQIWSRWIRELFNWAFTAPIFYFLLYLALLMMQTNRSGNEALFASMSFTANFFKMLNLVLFLVFLWAAVYMTRKTAGHFADVALNLGRKAAGFGLGVATGFAARGVARGALRFAPQIEKTMNAVGRTPLALALGRRTQAYIQKQRKQVEDLDKEYEGTSLEFKQAQLRSTNDAQRITAIGRAAVKDKQWGAVANNNMEDQVLTAARRLKLQEPIMQKLLHRVEETDVPGATSQEDAIAKVIRKITDKSDIDGNALLEMQRGADPVRAESANRVLREIWKNASRSDLGTIGQKNKKLQEVMTGYIQNLTDPTQTANAGLTPVQLQTKLKDFQDELGASKALEFDRYFNGTLMGDSSQGGWKPTNWVSPKDTSTTPSPGTPPVIRSTSVPMWAAGTAHTFTPPVTGGSGTMTWRFAGGFTPPSWLTIDSGTGIISADATAPARTTLAVPIEVEDGTGAISSPQTFLIRIT